MTSPSAPAASGFVVLHLGLGSFHRAHQAVYLQALRATGDLQWSLAGTNLRPDMADVLAALQAQGGAYTLETVSPAGEYFYEPIHALREVLPWDPALAAVIARGAAPSTRIVSFTVTEAGYYLDARGGLDLGFAELVADIDRARRGETGGQGEGGGATVYGAVTAILRARRAAGAGPVTLLGDAAHPLLPHTGQGAAQAMVDAVTLGTSLRDHTAIEPTLRAYEHERRGKTATLLVQGRLTAAMMRTMNPLSIAARDAAIRLMPVKPIVRILMTINRLAGTRV